MSEPLEVLFFDEEHVPKARYVGFPLDWLNILVEDYFTARKCEKTIYIKLIWGEEK